MAHGPVFWNTLLPVRSRDMHRYNIVAVFSKVSHKFWLGITIMQGFAVYRSLVIHSTATDCNVLVVLFWDHMGSVGLLATEYNASVVCLATKSSRLNGHQVQCHSFLRVSLQFSNKHFDNSFGVSLMAIWVEFIDRLWTHKGCLDTSFHITL